MEPQYEVGVGAVWLGDGSVGLVIVLSRYPPRPHASAVLRIVPFHSTQFEPLNFLSTVGRKIGGWKDMFWRVWVQFQVRSLWFPVLAVLNYKRAGPIICNE